MRTLDELRSLFDRIERDPADYPLFQRIWQVLTMAPSSHHAGEEELVSKAVDALDYLKAEGRWHTAAIDGRTELRLEGDRLHVYEDNDRTWQYRHTFEVGPTAGS